MRLLDVSASRQVAVKYRDEEWGDANCEKLCILLATAVAVKGKFFLFTFMR